ncbi:hypothetical protein NEHOM01_1692 [Nematocida homosporus]|uniref:uncharacterized protein n=1 Tax=Nematocida homosporus TaxID=1912981 RepID=UPI002220C152|nr:uncharacterized protein NEHOM01_1692 [Nematocida homosporus]KAI5186761.1 hypothetical protein NEHOM01_1692 [Nematocida homosporus]
MKLIFVFAVCLGIIRAIAIQKILRPNSTTIISEKIDQASMGITLDVNTIQGDDLYILSGFKNRAMEKVKLAGSYKRNLESAEPGEFEARVVNESGEFANVTISVYVDKAHEDTDEAEVLRKLLDKVRVDLVNIYNDVLKIKNMNIQSLSKTKTAKRVLWVVSASPGLYILLSILRLRFIKGFFTGKNPNKI